MNDEDFKAQPYDWVEDFDLEDGRYQNQCLNCGWVFLGLRGRTICRACSHPSQVKNSNE